jgi:hypothetical protein
MIFSCFLKKRMQKERWVKACRASNENDSRQIVLECNVNNTVSLADKASLLLAPRGFF